MASKSSSAKTQKAYQSAYISSSVALRILLILDTLRVVSGQGGSLDIPSNSSDDGFKCVTKAPRQFDPNGNHGTIFRVGVLAARGIDAAFQSYNRTFSDYLTSTAGQKFDPPLQFEMVPLTFETAFFVERTGIDFFFTNPSIFACIEAEHGAESLATVTSRRVVGDQVYELDAFAGVIVALAQREEITSIRDLEDKVVATAAISGFGSGQMQFRAMQNAGMSYINDPKQIVFTSNQAKIVQGLLSGEFDVGFIRTDQLERSKDVDGNPVNTSLFKVISPQENLEINGEPFPFAASTPLYPEWNVAALTHVAPDVSYEVQKALLDSESHAEAGRAYQQCVDDHNTTFCDTLPFPQEFTLRPQCETTKEVASLTLDAQGRGGYKGFRTTRSYMELRSMQLDTYFIAKDEKTQVWQCARGSTLYDIIKCPAGYYKRSIEEVDNGCSEMGLECGEDFQCVCKPCVEAFEVDVQPIVTTNEVGIVSTIFDRKEQGCEKMSICGSLKQREFLTFHVRDNQKRDNAVLSANIFEAGTSRTVSLQRLLGERYEYELNLFSNTVGVLFVEITLNGEQISQSPFRTAVLERNCLDERGSDLWEPNLEGVCQCRQTAVYFIGNCYRQAIFFPVVLSVIVIFLYIVVSLYLDHKKNEADKMWMFNKDEVVFHDPPEVIGRGSFGVVVLADYRGTKVAVKRLVPPTKGGSSKGSVGDTLSSNGDIESGRMEEFEIETISSYGLIREVDLAFCCGDPKLKFTKNFISEMRNLPRLRHPCVTTIMGAIISDFKEPMLVMEYMLNGSLYDLLRNETVGTSGDLMLQIARDIASGVRFLHSAKPPILHGNLKAQNVLVDSKFRAKVSDFALSQRNVGKGGSKLWMAPEVLCDAKAYTASSDMYSFGVILYEMYSRKDPYEGEIEDEVIREIRDEKIKKQPKLPESIISSTGTRLMRKCFHWNPQKRPSAAEVDETLDKMTLWGSEAHQGTVYKKERPVGPDLNMMYEVFPKHIADALNEGRQLEPESHEMVTVFFSDIVGFTDIASSFPPLKVSDLLDRLYLKFDSLTKKYGVFKVETIGDAYMGVTNLNNTQPHDHAKRIAEFALEAVAAASSTLIDTADPSVGYVAIRAGFHSGPVVSHIVGSLRPKYGLFGDTVNTASRMESNSLEGKIHCSLASATLLEEQSDIKVRRRGTIDIKGKGSMTTFWVS